MEESVNDKIFLDPSEMPKAWYNILPDLPFQIDPPLDPETMKPISSDKLVKLFPEKVVELNASRERWIEIPEPVREILATWRPVPLTRALRLERALGTPARIYYKYEGTNITGSVKLNSAIPQAYYLKQEGGKRIVTETGAGQWGCAAAVAATEFGLQCKVFMVRISYEQKPQRLSMMRAFGADVVFSPSNETSVGRGVIAKNPSHKGSLGIAIGEVIEEIRANGGGKYLFGSILNTVCMHQTIVGLEAKLQMEKAGEYPDIIIGCHGGGSNFAGITFPYIPDKLNGKPIRMIAVEPSACPSLTKGEFRYDYGDLSRTTPLLKMYTLGCDFTPPGMHAGGLRHHGSSPITAALYHHGIIEAKALPQTHVFKRSLEFLKAEHLVVAPEAAHAVAATIDEALECKRTGEAKTILVCISGHGLFDMSAYDDYFAGRLTDEEYSVAA